MEAQQITTKIIEVTSEALEQIKVIKSTEKNPSSVLRVGVIGGGCSGLSYKIEFGELKPKDNIQEFQDFKIAIDPKSSIYLKDTILDFESGLNGKGFIFKNPNAKNTCGCGESFSV